MNEVTKRLLARPPESLKALLAATPSRGLEVSPNLVVIRCFIYWTRDDRSLVSWLIRRVTGCDWSHVGIGFAFVDSCDNPAGCVAFEALFGLGFVGPTPWQDILAWAKQPGRSIMTEDVIPPSLMMLQEKYALALRLVGALGYAVWQLLAMWGFERLGIRVPRSPRRVVCSEIVARILFPEIELRTDGRSFDEVTPCSLLHAVQKVMRETRRQLHEMRMRERETRVN